MFKYVISAIVIPLLCVVFFFDFGFTNATVGNLFVAGIIGCLLVFSVFKFGLHYKILALTRFADAFYYSVFEYKKSQVEPSQLPYVDSVREQAEVALAANFDPTLKTTDLKIPATLYTGKNPMLDKLRAKIQAAEKIKLQARNLDRKADLLLGKTQEILVEKDLTEKKHGKLLDRLFKIEVGVSAIINLTVGELKEQTYAREPDYEIISRIALDDNPHFSRTFRLFESEDVASVLFRAPFMIILIGIIGTFAGFYLALNQGGDIKSGASVAIISSLVGLPVSLLMEHINTLFPDQLQFQQAFDKYKMSLEMLFIHERALNNEEDERETAKLLKEKERALEQSQKDHEEALAKQEAELEKQKQLELAKRELELKEQADQKAAKLLEEKEQALAKAESDRADALSKKEAQLEKQKQQDLEKSRQELEAQAKREAAKLQKETEKAIEQAQKEAADSTKETKKALAQAEKEAAKLQKEKEELLELVEQERDEAFAEREEELEAQKQKDLAKKMEELEKQAEREAAKLQKEHELALKEAKQEHKSELADLKAALEEEKVNALSEKEKVFNEKLEKQKKLLAKVAEEFAGQS